jgi:hypothetical protein
MEKLNEFQKEQIKVLSKYHPYTTKDVEHVYIRCGKSFDKTEKALELGCAYNSIERGIQEANLTTAST